MEPTPFITDVAQVRVCILHRSKDKKLSKKPRTDVLSFNEKTWSVVKSAATSRREKPQFRTSLYYDVVVSLPENPAETDGYHVSCYQSFTAIQSKTPSAERCSPHLRSSTPTTTVKDNVSAHLLPPLCIFCNSERKKKKDGTFEYLGDNMVLTVTERILEAAKLLQDQQVLSKVIGGDLVSKDTKYHHSCKSAYLLKAGRISSKTSDNEQKSAVSITNIHYYVEKFVIGEKRAELMTSLYDRYVDFCVSADETPMQKSSLSRNLTGKFGSKIKVQCPAGRKLGSILYNSEIADDSVRVAFDYSESEERILTKTALQLRKDMLNAPRKDLPENPTLHDVKDGDTTTPEAVKLFFRVLYTGKIAEDCGKRVQRRIDSSSQDALYIVQRGRAKPPKHITLGMALKSITGSKKLVQVMNRFGHCVNYSCLEELETATAEALKGREKACPEDTIPGLPMGLAFDNFDELTQTLSGSDTLHDTMGILYQNIPVENLVSSGPNQSIVAARDDGIGKSPAGVKKTKKKRSLTVSDGSIEPYFGVPKMTRFHYANSDVFAFPEDKSTRRAKDLDYVWMMSHALDADAVPMWVGFNSLFYKDKLPKQEVRYMPNLKEPITSLSVVRHTLVTTQKCAEECHQDYGVVTYDLNAAKPAMQIQATESPRFDTIFIMMGAFHIEMAFFKAIGKLVAESGGMSILTETEVIAHGSLNGLISGKHFNRCKRIHPLLALGFEVLHFQAFLQKNYIGEGIQTLMSKVPTNEIPGAEEDLSQVIGTDLFRNCAKQYDEFTQATLSGVHGVTAQFWMMYVGYINIFHRLERAIRTNDLGLFISTLTPIIDLFFATGHINYSRWLTKYQLDLLNVDDTHPGLRAILNSGCFSVRRTDNDFSRIPVDLTLEQTINADAASRMTGITSFTNDYSARLRWMVTKATRASFITSLLEMTGLITKEDIATELHPRRIERDNADLQKIITQICNTNNPFQENLAPESLYNISTGKVAREDIKKSLLGVPTKGKQRHQEFIQSCKEDPKNFERPIKKEKFMTFEDGCGKNRRARNNKVAALIGTRNLFGRLLVLATKKQLDMQHVLQYPLTPVPLTMASPDEVMAKTDKSALFGILEARVKDHGKPTAIDAYIIDGQFLLHSMPGNLPPTYGGLARSILLQSLRTPAKSVHILFDDYPQPSIKDTERNRRGADCRTFVITGPEQRRVPRDLNDALNSRSFKKQLPQFLAKEWQDPCYVDILGHHEVILDVPGECYRFKVQEGVIERTAVQSLINDHEESDTKICLHSLFCDNASSEIVVRASDTDIAVILLYHCNKFKGKLWMDVGTAAKNSRRYLSLTAIHSELGSELCAALPAFHAFTGSDYTSSFVKKGKVRPFKLLEKTPDYQHAFTNMTREALVSDATKATLFSFTADIYGAKKNKSLGEVRFQKFMKVYGPKRGKCLFSNLIGIDASGFAPCEDEVSAHIKRASFVAKMWAAADQQHLEQHPTEQDGWELLGGEYKLIWFYGEQLPDSLIPKVSELQEIEEEAEADMQVASSDEEIGSDEDD